MIMRTQTLRVLTASLILLTSRFLDGNASAADPVIARVKMLYETGKAHYDLGEWTEALSLYKEAFRLKSDPAFLFNIGQCYRKLGDPDNAALTYRSYLRDAPDSPNRAEVEKLVAEMDRAAAEKRANHPPTGTQAPTLDKPTPAPVAPATAAASTARGSNQLPTQARRRRRDRGSGGGRRRGRARWVLRLRGHQRDLGLHPR